MPKNVSNAQMPWHGLSLYFADAPSIFKAAEGLAIAHTLAKNWSEKGKLEKEELYPAIGRTYSALIGTPYVKERMPTKPEVADWATLVNTAAESTAYYNGGVVLAHTLKAITKLPDVLKKMNTPYSTHLASVCAEIPPLQLAGFALHLWQKEWQQPLHAQPATVHHEKSKKNTKKSIEVKAQKALDERADATDARAMYNSLLKCLMHVEQPDFNTLDPHFLEMLQNLNLIWILALFIKEEGIGLHGLRQKTTQAISQLKPFMGMRHNLFGEEITQKIPFVPFGYGVLEGRLFQELTTENVWLKALPLYQKGVFSPVAYQKRVLQRQKIPLKAQLLEALNLAAYTQAPCDGCVTSVSSPISRKAILESIIQDAQHA